MVKVAQLCIDAREAFREYDKPEPYFGTAPQALLQGFAHCENVEVDVVCCMQKPMHAPARLAPNIRYHGLLVPKIGWMRTGYQGCIRAVRKKLRELQPDIVHAQGTERDCAMSGVFSGLPNVLTIHGNHRLIAKVTRAKPFSYPWLAARLERFVLPRTDGIVCITKYTQEAVRSHARRTWVVPNAVDESFFAIKRNSDAIPTILCVGNICVRKNQQRLIQALDPIAAAQSLRMIFLGSAPPADPYVGEFMRMVKARPWCIYGGVASREELKEHLSRATLLALPSLEDNCPMVVLEAMAAGVPVVAANVGGVPDLIQHESTGLLCDPLDEKSIGEAIGGILDQPHLASTLAAQAKQIALAKFHPKRVATQHLAIYEEVIGKRRGDAS